MKKQTINLESDIIINEQDEQILVNYCIIQQSMSRTLFNQLKDNYNLEFKVLQKEYIQKFQVHARLFKSIWIETNRVIDSRKTRNQNRKELLKEKIKYLKLKIKKNDSYYLKNKLNKYKQELNKKQEINCTWGSKSLFNEQWNNEDHEVWLKEWRRQRDNRLYIIGAKCETFGNSLCQLQRLDNLRLTLPDKSHLNLKVNFDKPKKKIYQYLINAIKNGQALTWRIMQKDNGKWYSQVSFYIENECIDHKNGSLGIDINYNLIATATTKKDLNLESFKNFDFDFIGLNRHQITQKLSNIIIEIVNLAKNNKKTITIEKIDLEKCKAKDLNLIYNKKLSLIAYRKFIRLLEIRALKCGVLIKKVNPAYTSIIGGIKYQKRLGISRHTSASYVIARRSVRRNERVPRMMAYLLHGEEKSMSNFRIWGLVQKRLKTVPLLDSIHEFYYELEQTIFNLNSSNSSLVRSE